MLTNAVSVIIDVFMKKLENDLDLVSIGKLVERAHAGQVDKAGNPYHSHLIRVADRVSQKVASLPDGFLTAEEKKQAILLGLCHDLFEDTSVTEAELRSLGADDVFITRLYALSRLDKTTTYQEWISSLCEAGDVVPIIVKLADNEDNNDPARIAQLRESERSISHRYNRAHQKLSAALQSHLDSFSSEQVSNPRG